MTTTKTLQAALNVTLTRVGRQTLQADRQVTLAEITAAVDAGLLQWQDKNNPRICDAMAEDAAANGEDLIYVFACPAGTQADEFDCVVIDLLSRNIATM